MVCPPAYYLVQSTITDCSQIQFIHQLWLDVTHEQGLENLRHKQLVIAALVKLEMELRALAGLPILIDDTPGISIMELRTKARRASMHDRLEVIIVDYIQLMRTGEHEENRVQEIATITKNLKSLARELNVVVIGLSQLSRAAGDSGMEPKLSTLRESGSLEQDSDVVLMLWRDKEDTAVGAPKLIHGSIAKNRNGPTGIFALLFASEQAKFFSRASDDSMPV